jgi:hypothetical protein
LLLITLLSQVAVAVAHRVLPVDIAQVVVVALVDCVQRLLQLVVVVL